jgi:uncharacterized protein YciI
MAERVGFEPTCPLRDKTLSRRPRYDHFGTSPSRRTRTNRAFNYSARSRRLYARRPFRALSRVMFVIELVYKVALAEIDRHMRAHVGFLKKYYASGHFLVSGRKIPRAGGIILAVAASRQEIEAIVAEDPFCALGLADARIIEFRASQRATDIDARLERG